jgi:hypothetical protein
LWIYKNDEQLVKKVDDIDSKHIVEAEINMAIFSPE